MLKRSFYPKPNVEKILQGTAPKKISQRVNDLILKGAAKEREELIAEQYAQYDRETAADEKQHPRKKLSPTMAAAKRLFDPEDEPEDWYEKK